MKHRERPITYLQVQQMTGLPLGTLYSLVSRKQIPHMRMGTRLVRFNPTEVKKWMKSVRPKDKNGVEA
nr:hypothetical protein HAGR004_03390 [Bdellovibrio sp. HAGR004]